MLDASSMLGGISKLDNPYGLSPPSKARHNPILDRLAFQRTGPKSDNGSSSFHYFLVRETLPKVYNPPCKSMCKAAAMPTSFWMKGLQTISAAWRHKNPEPKEKSDQCRNGSYLSWLQSDLFACHLLSNTLTHRLATTTSKCWEL